MNIPIVNLKRMHNDLNFEIKKNISEIIDKNTFLNSPVIEKFEKKFAHMNNSSFCLGVSSGTSALSLALEASGIGFGDEVITSTNTFFSTYESIMHVGAKPVLVDVSEEDLNINIKKIESKITKKTKAIIPVHIYGNPCDMKSINKLSKNNNLLIIEDCAQSHFTKFHSKNVGNFSEVAAFSFYPGKNIGAFGDAGCIVTNKKKIYNKIKKLRNHGRVDKYKHDLVGYNYRMSSINASIINIKLKYIKKWNKIRQSLAKIYLNELTSEKNIKLFDFLKKDCESTFHLFVISVPKNLRSNLMKYLKSEGIQTGIHYPIPIHLQPACKYDNNNFPIMNKYKDKILSLPICPYTSEKEIMYTVKKIKNFFK